MPYNAPIIPWDGLSYFGVITKEKLFLDERKAEGNEYRVFPYADVDDKYGYSVERENCNRTRAFKGRDLEGWYQLTDVMESNRERLRGAGAMDRQGR